ncbi:uncharacterized protein DNG_09757 [Cephalotrichum gorgonifer]|uniref:NB-ARC domain-containing protein n=1 Tax=Cephalotrichum gorgonifer TaxID=2041049 RepID=A0AAE8SZQ7_9PEZI|nr:uncharacterized protein DNG_09757 [Cephalotrichum gorgonifer]
MDPISAVGLAAAIVQFAELGVKVVKRVAEFSTVAEEAPKSFKQITTELPLIIDGLRRIQLGIEAGGVDEATKRAVAGVVQNCLRETEEVDRILQKVLPAAGASSWERRGKAVMSVGYDKKIQRAVDSIFQSVRTLTFHQWSTTSLATPNVEEKPPPYPQALHWLVPFERNLRFVGRSDFFDKIEKAFASADGSQPKAALYGLGGIGKSQIALEFCYRKRKEGDCSVFWVNAATVDRFEESFKRIAGECGLVTRNDTGSDAPNLLKSWLEVRHEGPWLMIIDNVDDKDVFFREKMKNGETPAGVIPRCHHGSLLFTTRSRDIAVDVRLGADQPEKLVLDLLDALEYIPLAITQAVAFMVKRQKNIQQYLDQYQRNDVTKTKLLTYEFVDHGRQSSTMESVAKTWMISFESIRDSNKRAVDLLCLINFFQHQDIPVLLLQNEEEDEFDFEDATALLKDFSLIDTNDDDAVFSTHRLVQLATRWWLEKETPGEADHWASVALASVATHFPRPVPYPETNYFEADYFQLCEVLLPHAELMLRYPFKSASKDVELARAKLLNSTGRYLHWNGNHEEARQRFERSMEINKAYLGEKHIETMTSMGLLGWTLVIPLRDARAIPLLERLVEIRTELLGENDPRTIDALSDLATGHTSTGDFSLSERMQRDALSRAKSVLGPSHPDTLNCMTHLASVLEDQGKMDEAIQVQRVGYEARKQLLGDRHQSVLIDEHNLALMLCADDSTLEEGLSLQRTNIERKTEIFGQDHPETLIAAYNLLYLLNRAGRPAEARQVGARALALAHNGPRKDMASSQEFLSKIQDALDNIE